MFQYLKYMIQLILSPTHGWEDIEEESPDARTLLMKGLVPLTAVCALTEYLRMMWERGIGFGRATVHAILDLGVYFISAFVARLIFEMYLGRFSNKPDSSRAHILSIVTIGLMVLIQILDNILPWDLVILRFLPLFVVMIVYKSCSYMRIDEEDDLKYLLMASIATIAVPLVIYYIFFLLIP